MFARICKPLVSFDPMNLIERIRKLKERVHRHGQYDAIAAATGLSASFLQKFATTDDVYYKSRSIEAVEAFFASRRGASARKR